MSTKKKRPGRNGGNDRAESDESTATKTDALGGNRQPTDSHSRSDHQMAESISKDESVANSRDARSSVVIAFADYVSRARWVAWARDEASGKKPPVNALGKWLSGWNKPENWLVLEKAQERATRADGIGIVLTTDDDLACIDLDSCRDPTTGTLTDWAVNILRQFNTYAEVSPSSEGVKAFARGIPDDLRGHLKCVLDLTPRTYRHAAQIELFSGAEKLHYVTVTGQLLPDYPSEIKAASEATWRALAARIEAVNAQTRATKNGGKTQGRGTAGRRTTGFKGTREEAARAFLQELADEVAAMKLEDGLSASGTNTLLNNNALSLGTLVKAGELTEAEVLEKLYEACDRAGYVAKEGATQMRSTINSGIRKGIASGELDKRFLAMLGGPSIWAQRDLTEGGNSNRIVNALGNDMLYCKMWKSWLVWDGKRWARDRTDRARWRAEKTLLELHDEAARLYKAGQQDDAKAVTKWAQQSRSRKVVDNSLNMAGYKLPITTDKLDTDDWSLNVLNGTLDLRTFELREHRREDFNTKLSPVAYDPKASCPKWLEFIHRTYGNDVELVAFIKRAFGYSLTGSAEERALFLMFGKSGSGKTTLMELLMALLGEDYSCPMDFSTLLHRDTDKVRNDIAKLFGKRAVGATEANAERCFDQVVLKKLTGNDTITARFLHEEFFDFLPKFKIWLGTNKLPKIRDAKDDAMWQRINVIPHDHPTPQDQQDKKLRKKLLGELPGILNWALEGCREWQQNGLQPPKAVQAATALYREEQDILERFVKENFILTDKAQDFVPQSKVPTIHAQWCNDLGFEPIPRLGAQLGEIGWKRGTKKVKLGPGATAKAVAVWVGVKEFDVNQLGEDFDEAADMLR